jgi:hypothetical protein
MADLSEIERSEIVRITGSSSDGTEQTPIGSTSYGEIFTHDVFDNGWTSLLISIAAGATAEIKVGVSKLANRKGIFLQAKGKDVTFGHSASVLPFDAFKNQFFSLPIGDGTSVFLKNNGASSVDVAVGELA